MHSIYTGVTQTGKTTLARRHSRLLHKKGHTVFVYDPVMSLTAGGDWACDFITDDFDTLHDYLIDHHTRKSGAAHVFIDEAGELFSVGQRDNHWLLTRGRHMGFTINLIAQRPTMMAPTARTQCGRGYMFRMAPDDMDVMGKDFGHGQLGNTPMDCGDYIVLTSGSPAIEKFNCFKQTD
jgi:hypothetical protein